MIEQFSILGPNQRIEVLKAIIADLSPYEKIIAKKELLLGKPAGSPRFDILSCVPVDVAYRILAYLRPSSLTVCCWVNKTWKQYASSARVIGDHVKNAKIICHIPNECGTVDKAFRWLADRELRWERARPIFAKTIEVRSQISALVVGGSLIAASCDRSLKVWRISGTALQQIVNVRANTANRISICSSGRHVAFSSYLREAKVYSVPNGRLVFEVRSAVVPIDQVDILGDMLAVLKRENIIEVYNWRGGAMVSRFQLEQNISICAVRLCLTDLLVVALVDWSVLVYSIEKNMILYTWSAQLDSRTRTTILPALTQCAPKIKATLSEANFSNVLITLFNRHTLISLVIDPYKQKARIYDTCHFDPVKSTLLETHFLYKLVSRENSSSNILHQPVSCGIFNDRMRELRVPRPSTAISNSRKPIITVPEIACSDDSIVALGYSNAKLISVFSFTRTMATIPVYLDL
ncbi:hypothetical protein FB645_004168 [Coemansia sp. IMI 203386]|nr:hypothetical protein FB645_004168 [Coemansia sp. IMI 203386]